MAGLVPAIHALRRNGGPRGEKQTVVRCATLPTPMLKVRDILRLLEQDGWVLVATRGSHRQFKHPSKPGRVTVAGKPAEELGPGTLNSIRKQAGLERKS